MKSVSIAQILLGVILSAHVACASGMGLPAWVSDHMILPAGRSCTFTGTAEPGEAVSVRFNEVIAESAADSSGNWKLKLASVPAGMKGKLIFTSGAQEKVIADVVAGDIWLCAGQSNMQRTVALTDEATEAVEDIKTVDVRYFNGRSWVNVTAGNVAKISAVAVYFSTEIARRQKTPVGIFVAAVGGTRIETWMPAEAFPDTESGRMMKPLVNDPEVLKAAEEDRADFKPYGQHRLARWGLGRAVPASLFEQLIRPFADLPVCGVVWYQGEGNTSSVDQAQEYRLWLVNLISAYRTLWNNPDLPFIIIQLPSFNERPAWAVLQDVQADVAKNTPNAAIVNIKDLGDLKDIHPRRKKEVGRRAAEAALGLPSR